MIKAGDNVTPRDPKEEGGYEDVKFQKCLGGTTACIKRLSIATEGCGELTPNDTYVSIRWFISVKTVEEAMVTVVDYCGPVNTSHKGFLSSYDRNVDERLSGRLIYCYEE